MGSEKTKTEDQLYNDALALLSKGHRMTYIFKYIRERSESDEVLQRVVERLTANN
ncbi:MAG: hypothetical protein ACI8X3_002261 [Saprospiraceae bacterium]|jgi:hypothetical protein